MVFLLVQGNVDADTKKEFHRATEIGGCSYKSRGIKDYWWTTEASRKDFKSRVLISPQTFPCLIYDKQVPSLSAVSHLPMPWLTICVFQNCGRIHRIVFSYLLYDCLRQPCWEMDIARFPLFYCNCVNPFPNNLTCKETTASEVILEWEGDEGQRSKLYLPALPFFQKKEGPLEWMAFFHGPSTLGSIIFTQATIQVCISFRTPWQSPPE